MGLAYVGVALAVALAAFGSALGQGMAFASCHGRYCQAA